jgi:two-component system, OmpR family, phosphate regulon sensor histidine kinase PhoR
VTFRTRVFLIAITVAEVSVLAVVLLLSSMRDVTGTAAAITIAAATIVALVLAWTLPAPLVHRVQVVAERVRRSGADDASAAASDSDEIATLARGVDDLVRVAAAMTNLEADRARLAAILGGMIEGVLVVNEHGRLQLANDAARRMLRMDAGAEGRHYPEIVRHPAVAEQIATVLSGGISKSVELTALRDAGVTLIARTAAVDAPRGRGAVVVLHDITDLRRADQIRRDFVANVSHELRTPLTAIRGYVEALGDATPEEGRRFLSIVSRHTLRMERLVRDLLRLARLDAGQETLERHEYRVAAIADAVETDLAGLIASRALRVERDIAPDAESVHGDAAKLQDAFRNLLENAANYSPPGGTITLRSRRGGSGMLLSIEDEGPGIPPADLGRVFERFYRVDKSRTREGADPGGTGLGLAIVRHLIELHGGTVTAANRATGGAVFTVELPM